MSKQQQIKSAFIPKVRVEPWRVRNWALAPAVLRRMRNPELTQSEWIRDLLDQAAMRVFKKYGPPTDEDYEALGLDPPGS